MNHYKKLSDFIKENIYSKMSKKDVKEIMSHGLGGSLISAIDEYKKECVKLEVENIKDEYESTIKRLKEELRVYQPKSSDVYREGSVID